MSRPLTPKKKRIPAIFWIVLALIGTIWFFWILPIQLGPRPVAIDFHEDR